MALVLDSTQTFSNGVSASTHNINFNNAGGTFLIVLFSCLRNVAGDSISGITYNGVALTKLAHQNGSVNNRTANAWYLSNPATGSNTLSITLVASERVYGAVHSFTGHDTTTPIDVFAQGNATGTTLTFPIVTVTDGAYLLSINQANRNFSSAGTNTTVVNSVNATSMSLRNTNAVTTAGSTSLAYTVTTSDPGTPYIIAAIRPSAGGGGAPAFRPRVMVY